LNYTRTGKTSGRDTILMPWGVWQPLYKTVTGMIARV